MGRTAHCRPRLCCRLSDILSDSNVHRIDDFLHEEWIDVWASEVVGQVEDYLAKHAAFHAFLEDGSGAAGAV